MFRPLCAENPLPAARRVYEYLQSLSGKCLTGQMESQWCPSTEHDISYLTDVTGRQPAIRGLDFMDNDYLGVTQRAKDWWARGGIPTICWHTGADLLRLPRMPRKRTGLGFRFCGRHGSEPPSAGWA